MKKIILILFFNLINICLFSQRINTFQELITINDSLNNQITYFCIFTTNDYKMNYFKLPLSFESLLDFYENNKTESTFDLTEQILKNNIKSFKIKIKRDKLIFNFKDTAFFEMRLKFNYKIISDDIVLRKSVRFFRNDELGKYDEIRDSLFREDLKLVYQKYKNLNYKFKIFPKDKNYSYASSKGIVILYQYDLNSKMIIHESCSKQFRITSNNFYIDLENLCKKYCTIYNFDKVIFSALYIEPN